MRFPSARTCTDSLTASALYGAPITGFVFDGHVHAGAGDLLHQHLQLLLVRGLLAALVDNHLRACGRGKAQQ